MNTEVPENASITHGADAPKQTSILNFEFRGDGMEYFKIWIVNILLTLVTLGIYSAWATVRNNRYFYSNLYLENTNFRYLADPITILKGRIIAIVAFIAYYVASIYAPIVGVMIAIALVFAIPYFVNQSVAFTNRMSAYKNIQFRFKGSYGEAFMVIYIWPLLGVLTLGILYPLAILKANEYFVRNSAYGTTQFDFKATYKDYGMIFLTMIGIALAIGIPMGLLTYLVPAFAMISPVVIFAVYFGLFVYFMVSMTNVFYASLSLVEHKFDAKLTVTGQTKVILINLFFTIITLGLYLPAAKVRMTKYICSCITMHAQGSLDTFTAAEKENISALGEEMGQVFDFA